MISLHGFQVSNYYNKVKLALLEKNAAFTEVHVHPTKISAEQLAASPLGKIPYITTEHGNLCESQAILDYIDSAYPNPPLMPSDPFAAAKVRELSIYIDLHLELVARELYPQAFFGGAVSENTQTRVRNRLQKNIAAFMQLAKFAPCVAGDSFTQADCAAYVHLPLVGIATKVVLGEDMLLAAGLDYKPYLRHIAQRPSAQRVDADRKAASAAMAKS
jgi:glutathione S-transferase